MKVPFFAALLAAATLPSVIVADAFTAPRAGTDLDVSGPITVAWEKPKKPSDEWRGLVTVTAFFNWRNQGHEDTWFYDIATNQSNDRAGEAEWNPRGIRAFIEANSTSEMSVVFSASYDKTPPEEATNVHEGRGWLTDNFRIKGQAFRNGAGPSRGVFGSVALGLMMQCLLLAVVSL